MLDETDRKFLRMAYDEAKAGFDEAAAPLVRCWRAVMSWSRAGAISGCSRVIRSPMVKWMHCAKPAGSDPIAT